MDTIKVCKILGCTQPRIERSGFCREHHRIYNRNMYQQHKAEHKRWFERNRQQNFKKLIAVSSLADKKAIEKGQDEGRQLRREVEAL